ncbi:hypothetical protein J3R83DRAFT_9715 [Lanmaoa asiatica]|nr:hypothetical protein J3R83DRAFT_9715 [Lanmaoa asiatica]
MLSRSAFSACSTTPPRASCPSSSALNRLRDALVFYGLQSAVEVISALLVTWRFLSVTKPGDETDLSPSKSSPQIIR